MSKLEHANLRQFATDISWSRLFLGLRFLRSQLGAEASSGIEAFAGDFFRLPFLDKAIDIVWTSHALEPNGGREHDAIAELFRVARKYLILFEPCYEENSAEGKARMDSLGYIKGLREVIARLGGTVERSWRAQYLDNPLNPTHIFIVRPPGEMRERPQSPWACPATKTPMRKFDGYFWSEHSLLAYPILKDIPVLRVESAILASALAHEPL